MSSDPVQEPLISRSPSRQDEILESIAGSGSSSFRTESFSHKKDNQKTTPDEKEHSKNLKHKYAFENKADEIRNLPEKRAYKERLEIDNITTYPLHYAAMGRSIEVTQVFLETETNKQKRYKIEMLEACNYDGEVHPLHVAALYGAWETRQGITNGVKSSHFLDLMLKENLDKDEAGYIDIYHDTKTGAGTALHFACMQDNHDFAQRIINEGVDINKSNNATKITPLHIACEYNAQKTLDLLLNENIDVFACDAEGNNAIHYAARSDSQECIDKIVQFTRQNIKPLIKQFYEDLVYKKNNMQCTPLKIAVEHGSIKTINYLLDNRYFPEYKEFLRETDLAHIAAKKGYSDILQSLQDHEYGIEHEDQGGRTPLHIAALFNQIESIRTLQGINLERGIINGTNAIINGTKPDANDGIGYTPLFCAALNDYVDAFKLLWNPQFKTKVSFSGDSVLMVTVKHNAIKCFMYILDHSTDQEIKQMLMLPNLHLNNPLHMVAMTGNWDIFQKIIYHYKDINMRNLDLHTPLHLAIINKNINIVKELLSKSICSINSQDKNKDTPLTLAVKSNSENMIKLLLKYGADISPTNLLGIALKDEKSKSVNFLLQQLKHEHSNRSEVYPLHDAIQHKQKDVIKKLLKKPYILGQSMIYKIKNNQSCMDLALELEYEEGVKLLIELEGMNWKILMRRRETHKNDSPIQMMLAKMPHLLVRVFDRCIENGYYKYEFLEDIYYATGMNEVKKKKN